MYGLEDIVLINNRAAGKVEGKLPFPTTLAELISKYDLPASDIIAALNEAADRVAYDAADAKHQAQTHE